MDLKTFTEWATIFTFLFAVGTYWFDFSSKRKNLKVIKNNLITELRTLLNAVRKDILLFEEIMTGKINEYRRAVYHIPITKSLISSGNIFKQFKDSQEFGCITQILLLIEQIDSIDSIGRQRISRGDKEALNFFFKERLVPLRQTLVELTRTSNSIDLAIMPKSYADNPQVIHAINDYKTAKSNEEKSREIISKYSPETRLWDLPDQYFGE